MSLLVITIILYSASVSAQSTIKITGKVYDNLDGSLISDALILINYHGYETKSDQFGNFSLENIIPGLYELTISAPAYYDTSISDLIVNEDVTTKVAIYLSPKLYELRGITVVSRCEELRIDNIEVIERNDIENLGYSNLSEILGTVEGLFIQQTGTSSGRSEIRIRGASPKQILVLVDGQKINPSGSGVADINSIPVEMIGRIEVYKEGASSEFGPDAMGGVINITTHQLVKTENVKANLLYTIGKWDTKLSSISLSNLVQSNKLSTAFAYSYRSTDGNFPFNYSVQPRPTVYSGERVNNQSHVSNYFATCLYKLSNKANLSFSAQSYKGENGLPDRASLQNEYSYNIDERKLISSYFDYQPTTSFRINVITGFSQYRQYFWDMVNINTSKRFESEFMNRIYNLNISSQISAWKGQNIKSGVELRRDILDHNDLYRTAMNMGHTVRTNVGLYFLYNQRFSVDAIPFVNYLSVETALRHDKAETENDDNNNQHTTNAWSPKAGFSFVSDNIVKMVLRGSYGKSFRLPSLNSLFWKADVLSTSNPDLRPERAEHSEVGVEISWGIYSLRFKGSFTYFHSYVKDIIVWGIGQGGVWRPINRDAALTTGHEDYLSFSFFDELVQLTYQNSITTAQNKSPGHNEYNKQLTYVPHYTSVYSAVFKLTPITIKYSIRNVDIRYLTTANTKWYESYSIHDLNFSSRFKLFQEWTLSINYKTINLTDENYVLITHYPMPGREWGINIGLSYEGNIE